MIASAELTWIAISAVASSTLALMTFVVVVASVIQTSVQVKAARHNERAADAAVAAAGAAEAGTRFSADQVELARGHYQLARKDQERGAELAILQRNEAMEQRALSVLPLVHCEMHHRDDGGVSVTVRNRGTAPAFDVKLKLLAAYLEADVPRADFAADFARPEHEAMIATREIIDDEFYGVYDTLYYEIVPSAASVSAPLGFPLPPGSVHVILQFRNVYGANYAQVWWLADLNDEKRYRLGSVEPHAPAPAKRLSEEEERGTQSLMPEHPLATEWEREVRPLLTAAVSVGWLKTFSDW